MEYLEGQSLQRVLSRFRNSGAPLPLDFLGAVLCGILQGLVHAHTATGATTGRRSGSCTAT